MNYTLCVLIACAAALFAQRQAHKHQESLRVGRGRLSEFHRRIQLLEASDKGEIDPKAFEELKTKVEGLRLAQGLRR